jgi:hypothetical protein
MRAALTALLLTFASQAALAEKIFVDGDLCITPVFMKIHNFTQ